MSTDHTTVVRRRASALVLLTAGLVVVGLLALFAIALSDTQANSRAAAQGRMNERAALAGALVESMFQSVVQGVPQDARLYGARTVSVEMMNAARGQDSYLALLNTAGGVIASSRGFGPEALWNLRHHSAALALVRAGHPYGVGNVRSYSRAGVVNVAVRFSTLYGPRILVMGVRPAGLDALLGGELRKIPGVQGARNYVIDRNDTVLASTNRAEPAGYRFTRPSAVRALNRTSGNRNGRYYAEAPIAGSTWRLVVSAPDGPLFASVSGLHKWLPWLIFVAFAMMAAAALLLARRVLRTAQREVAAATEASAMKSNFVANMSHEIRTPLNGVTGMMNLLADTDLTAEQQEYVTLARHSGEALMTVINDILDVAKIEAGRLEIEHRDFNLPEMVEATCEMSAAIATEKGLELQSFVHLNVPRQVCGDRLRVGQILSNLVSNAVKFTAEGEVVVEVTVSDQTGQEPVVCFEVRDTGIGISPDHASALFEPFSQADAGTTRRFGGTGLGLTIAKELTQIMGGAITATGRPGVGSTFRFSIPLAPAEADIADPIPASELGRLRVLVVDDNATNRRIFEAYVTSWGMRPTVASDAALALTYLHQAADAADPYDIALLDYNMPGQDGIELARQITASAALRRTRLILLTSSGHGHSDDPATGIVSCLTKPIRQSRLLDAISAAMATTNGQPRTLPGSRTRPSATPTGHRVLVAEDQHVNWTLIDRLLTKRGHSVYSARNGREAVDMLSTDTYDLLLMDCQMPILDGYNATREIRAQEASRPGPPIPIIAMTANAMLGDRDKCLAAGMNDYIAKPINPDLLDQTLTRWLPASTPPDPPTGDDQDDLDRARLQTLRSVFSPEEMHSMLNDLTSTVSVELDELDHALTEDDQDAARAATHRLKNSAAMIGATKLEGTATELEAQLGPESENPPHRSVVSELHDHWTAAHASVSETLAILSTSPKATIDRADPNEELGVIAEQAEESGRPHSRRADR